MKTLRILSIFGLSSAAISPLTAQSDAELAGIWLAQGFSQQVEMNSEEKSAFLKGFEAAISGEAVALTPEQMEVVKAFLAKASGQPEETAEKGDLTGSPAPLANVPTLEGESWNLGEWKGKVVLVDFWATWCGPCRAAMPKMKAIWDEFGDHPDFAMVGVSLDRQRSALEGYVEKEELGWLQVFQDPESGEPNALAQAGQIQYIPTIWLVDKEGVIQAINPDKEKLSEMIQGML